MASKTCNKGNFEELLGRERQAFSSWWPTTVWYESCHTSESSIWDFDENTSWTPRNSRCWLQVSSSVWWAGISKQVENFVTRCPTCMKNTPPPVEPMLQSSLPSHPWEKVGADFFRLKDSTYVVVVDYYSRYVRIQKLISLTSAGVTSTLKAILFRHCISVELRSDTGPQCASQEMNKFAEMLFHPHDQ